jgi:hypothetical protein
MPWDFFHLFKPFYENMIKNRLIVGRWSTYLTDFASFYLLNALSYWETRHNVYLVFWSVEWQLCTEYPSRKQFRSGSSNRRHPTFFTVATDFNPAILGRCNGRVLYRRFVIVTFPIGMLPEVCLPKQDSCDIVHHNDSVCGETWARALSNCCGYCIALLLPFWRIDMGTLHILQDAENCWISTEEGRRTICAIVI